MNKENINKASIIPNFFIQNLGTPESPNFHSYVFHEIKIFPHDGKNQVKTNWMTDTANLCS